MSAIEELRLIPLGVEVGRAASLLDAYTLIVRRIEAATGAPCALRAQNSAGWHTLAQSDRSLDDVGAGRVVRIPLPHGRGETELVIGLGPQEREDADGQHNPRAGSGAALLEDDEWREMLGNVLCAALQLVALRAQHTEAQQFADLVRDFSQSLLAVSDSETLHRLIVEGFARAVQADIASLAVYQAAENALAVVATHGYPAVLVEHVRIAPGQGVVGQVFSTGEPVWVTGPAAPGRSGRRRYRTDSYVALPLLGPDGVVGVISVTDKQSGEPFPEADLNLLTSLSFAAALAVSREVMRTRTEDLAHLATVDPLTGLFNRRYFETRLEQEIQRQRRQFDELSLLMLDLDNFKDLNDTQGHLVGDMALKEVAEILRRAIRIFDVCARFGGEEFVILMPGAGPSTALRIAERIRRQVEQHFATGLRSSVPVPLTVSIGVSTATPAVTREALIAEADTAMLRAKVTGKNQVNLHTSA